MPSSAPLMYNFNVNTQPPVIAVPSKQPSATIPIGKPVLVYSSCELIVSPLELKKNIESLLESFQFVLLA